jgi:glycerophosphoryl diester phosphodiesterase
MPTAAVSEYLAGAGPRILAHRGLAREAPENTLLSFLQALAAGATHLETDVQVTRDGIAVLCHDPDLARLVGRATRIDELPFAQLKKIDLGHGQTVPSLAEALAAFPEARFNLDIKEKGAALPAARAVLEERALGRVLITSFSEARRRRAVALLPGVATSASAPVIRTVVAASAVGLTRVVRRALAGYDAVQVPERVRAFRVVTRRFVAAMHDAGVEVHVWTVNDPVAMARLLDLGVDGIVTDRCDLAAAVVAARI